jgi:hypothetical protein
MGKNRKKEKLLEIKRGSIAQIRLMPRGGVQGKQNEASNRKAQRRAEREPRWLVLPVGGGGEEPSLRRVLLFLFAGLPIDWRRKVGGFACFAYKQKRSQARETEGKGNLCSLRAGDGGSGLQGLAIGWAQISLVIEIFCERLL